MVRELRQADPRDNGVIARVARQLGVGPESLRIWVTRSEIEEGKRPGMTEAERSELVALRKENRELRRANDILQAAATFFGAARPSTEEVVTFIDVPRNNESGGRRWGVEPICEQLAVAPSTYYDVKSRPASARDVRDAELGPQLEALGKRNHSVYGRRKLTKAAKRRDLDVGRDQVERLMKRQGIRGASRAKRRFTTHADVSHLRAPDLVSRNFVASRPDQLWVADFTYCSTWSGVVYVAFIIDVFSRRLVGWKASRSMTASLVVDALNTAAWTRRTSLDGLICHTDAGSQYTSVSYTDRIDELGVSASIGTVGDSYDNALAESVMGLFKTELHRNPAVLADNGGHWRGLDDLEVATCAWVSWFNEERLHGELDDRTPAEVEEEYALSDQAKVA